MAAQNPLVVHRNVALMMCESPAILEEILVELDLGSLIHQRIGARAIVAPAPVLDQLRAALHARSVYPRVVGDIFSHADEEE